MDRFCYCSQSLILCNIGLIHGTTVSLSSIKLDCLDCWKYLNVTYISGQALDSSFLPSYTKWMKHLQTEVHTPQNNSYWILGFFNMLMSTILIFLQVDVFWKYIYSCAVVKLCFELLYLSISILCFFIHLMI